MLSVNMMTTGQDATFEDPIETTPTDVTHHTTGSGMTSSSSEGAGLYVYCALLVITMVGTAANGLVLYGLIASKQHKKHVLILNQNMLDLVNCLFLSVDFSLRLCDVFLSGILEDWRCVVLFGAAGAWGAYVGSMINLAAISIERYLKIVHHAWAKKRLRKWMIYSAVAFAWIGGIVLTAAVNIPTFGVVEGVCYTHRVFKSQASEVAFWVWEFLYFYVIILLIFVRL